METRLPHSPPKIAVLGAGLAGLTVARTLLEQGRACQVIVLEREARPGGMARSVEVGGQVSDLGPHRLYSALSEMRTWFQRELGDSLLSVERSSRMFAQGRYLRYPPSPVELLGAYGPLRMAHFAVGAASARFRAALGGLEPDSFASVMERNFGRPLCEALVFPYIRKTWKLEPERVSARAAQARATMGGIMRMVRRLLRPQEEPGQETTLRQFQYVRGGIERLVEHLTRGVERLGGRIVCHAEVLGLERDGQRIRRIRFLNRTTGQTETLDCDFVFSTLPLPALMQNLIVPRFETNDLYHATQALRFLETRLVFASVRRSSLSRDHWLYFPEARPALNRAYESRNFDASLGREGRTLICLEGTTLAGSEDADWSDSDLAGRFVREIASTGLFQESEVETTHVERISEAYPLYEMGYERPLAVLETHLRRFENLISFGRQGLFHHNNMDHTIFSGLCAARCWAEEQNPTAAWFEKEIPRFEQFRIVD
jgi:protoporphyrinogen oxidase